MTTISLVMALVWAAAIAAWLPVHAVLTVCCLAMGGWGMLRSWPRIVGTTLIAPWAWSGAALMAVAVVELGLSLAGDAAEPQLAGHLRFLAAAATFCPVMAVLGAKRPQDRAWQFIVLSLWVVLVMPVGESLLNRPGAELTLHAGRLGFMLVLLSMGVTNRLATRAWLPGALWGAGQALLLAEHIPLPFRPAPGPSAAAGLGLLALSMLWPMCRGPENTVSSNALQRLWLDFRDAYGTVWALRVMERFNAAAEQQRLGQRLVWHGVVSDDRHRPAGADRTATLESPAIHSDATGDVPRDLRMLLLRFVSPDWIEARTATTTDARP